MLTKQLSPAKDTQRGEKQNQSKNVIVSCKRK